MAHAVIGELSKSRSTVPTFKGDAWVEQGSGLNYSPPYQSMLRSAMETPFPTNKIKENMQPDSLEPWAKWLLRFAEGEQLSRCSLGEGCQCPALTLMSTHSSCTAGKGDTELSQRGDNSSP